MTKLFGIHFTNEKLVINRNKKLLPTTCIINCLGQCISENPSDFPNVRFPFTKLVARESQLNHTPTVAQYYEMTEFNPPISKRETEELIQIKYSSTDDWSQDAINQAKAELIKRKIPQREQDKLVNEWDKQYNEYVKAEQLTLESNKTESYKNYEMVLLFLFGPLIFFSWHSYFSRTIFELKRDNCLLKLKQRLIIVSISSIFWILFIGYDIKYGVNESEKKRMEEIEKIDISEWEKKHGYDK